MGNREVPFSKDEKCDICGKLGAFDFMGDLICDDCLKPKQGAIQVQAKVKSDGCGKWQKERPTKPCVFMTRVWNKRLGMYDYDIWRFEKVDCGDEWYLQWLTEDGAEWGDIKYCNFDEYCIIESKSV